jgi:hypothetical protein
MVIEGTLTYIKVLRQKNMQSDSTLNSKKYIKVDAMLAENFIITLSDVLVHVSILISTAIATATSYQPIGDKFSAV